MGNVKVQYLGHTMLRGGLVWETLSSEINIVLMGDQARTQMMKRNNPQFLLINI